MPFTDLHSHILPGFDDGASDDTEFLDMARIAVRGGTARMAATPHYDLESPDRELQAVHAAVEEHRELLRIEGIPLVLVPGVEVRVNAGLYDLADGSGELRGLTLGGNGRYLLCDLPLIDMPTATADILFRVQLHGLVPILAHPERNRFLSSRLEAVRELVERGVEVQINSGSLEGLYGKAAQRSAFALLDEGLARIVASDAHKPDGRSPDLSGAARMISRQYGEEAVGFLLAVNPERALAGEDLAEVPAGPQRRSGRGRFFARGRQR